MTLDRFRLAVLASDSNVMLIVVLQGCVIRRRSEGTAATDRGPRVGQAALVCRSRWAARIQSFTRRASAISPSALRR